MALINPYRSALTAADLLDADTACVAGKFVEVGRYTVPAGMAICLGYGGLAGQDQAEGRIYSKLQKAGPAAVPGMVRLVLLDPQDRPVETLFEARTEQLETSATDRTQQMPFPEHPAKFGEDWTLSFQLKGDAADTVDVSICTLFMEVTTFTVR